MQCLLIVLDVVKGSFMVVTHLASFEYFINPLLFPETARDVLVSFAVSSTSSCIFRQPQQMIVNKKMIRTKHTMTMYINIITLSGVSVLMEIPMSEDFLDSTIEGVTMVSQYYHRPQELMLSDVDIIVY